MGETLVFFYFQQSFQPISLPHRTNQLHMSEQLEHTSVELAQSFSPGMFKETAF